MKNADLDRVFGSMSSRSGEAQPDREQDRLHAAGDRCPLHVDTSREFENAGFLCHALGNDGIKGPEFEADPQPAGTHPH